MRLLSFYDFFVSLRIYTGIIFLLSRLLSTRCAQFTLIFRCSSRLLSNIPTVFLPLNLSSLHCCNNSLLNATNTHSVLFFSWPLTFYHKIIPLKSRCTSLVFQRLQYLDFSTAVFDVVSRLSARQLTLLPPIHH